jgi:hypothetical protein
MIIEVLTAVSITSFTFWDIKPYGQLRLNRRFGGTYCLELQCRKLSHAMNQYETGRKRIEAVCFSETSLDILIGLYGILSQEIEFFLLD